MDSLPPDSGFQVPLSIEGDATNGRNFVFEARPKENHFEPVMDKCVSNRHTEEQNALTMLRKNSVEWYKGKHSAGREANPTKDEIIQQLSNELTMALSDVERLRRDRNPLLERLDYYENLRQENAMPRKERKDVNGLVDKFYVNVQKPAIQDTVVGVQTNSQLNGPTQNHQASSSKDGCPPSYVAIQDPPNNGQVATLQARLHDEDESHQYQKPDDTILRAFESLVGQIKNFTRSAVSTTPPTKLGPIPAEDIAMLRGVVPQITSVDGLRQYITETKLRKYFVSGIILLRLSRSFFDDGNHVPGSTSTTRDQWLPEDVRDSIHLSEDELLSQGVTSRAYHIWRANTMALLSSQQTARAVDCAREFLEAESKQIMRIIGPFLGRTMPPSSLAKILNQALTLSFTLRRQRAAWYLHFPRVGNDPKTAVNVAFDSTQMKDTEAGAYDDQDAPMEDAGYAGIVGIFIAPALLKQGNMDGENYEEVYPVAKAEVWISNSGIASSGPARELRSVPKVLQAGRQN